MPADVVVPSEVLAVVQLYLPHGCTFGIAALRSVVIASSLFVRRIRLCVNSSIECIPNADGAVLATRYQHCTRYILVVYVDVDVGTEQGNQHWRAQHGHACDGVGVAREFSSTYPPDGAVYMARSVFIHATVPFDHPHSISRKQRHLLSLPNTSPMSTNKSRNCSRRRTSTKLVILSDALHLHRPVHSRLRHPPQKAAQCRSDVPDSHEAIRSARAKLTCARGSGGAVIAGSTIIQFDAVVVAVVVRRQ
mmetsp:Transcript_29597/g.54322  ORF Transcript_29597/g.54322 Transcript_29597/m.54322 type:complete len:249 (-) Transcript_29597:580-1326(-)